MQYIILLRGVNVGGRNIKMQELRYCLEKSGFKNVITVLQTGNAILETNKVSPEELQGKIETVLEKAFNYPAQVLAISPDKLQKIINAVPFKKKNDDFHRYILFTKNGFEKDIVKKSPELDNSLEEIVAGKNVVYWRVKKNFTLDSTFGKYLGKSASKEFVTNRNLNTLEKIIAKVKKA